MGDTDLPPMERIPGKPADVGITAGAPKKRGPKPDHETALRVAESITTVARDSDRKDHLEGLQHLGQSRTALSEDMAEA